MWPFAQQHEPPAAPALSDSDKLLLCELELREAEKRFTAKCFALARYSAAHKNQRVFQTNVASYAVINAMNLDPIFRKLQNDVEQARDLRNELLAKRALLRSTGETK